MTKVVLEGPAWTAPLVSALAPSARPSVGNVRTLEGGAAERALFFAQVIGFDIRETPEGQEISAAAEIASEILEHAAHEVMRYFGRVSVDRLRPRRQMILSRAVARWNAMHDAAPAQVRSARRADTVEVQEVDTPHEGFFLTRSYRLRHPQFDGGLSEDLTREVFVATDAAIVLPYDPARDRILLVEQFRMGPFGRGDPLPWVLEPVAGRVDAGETPEECARRECLEEAELELERLEHATSHYCSPGCSTEVFHCYVGICALPDAAPSLGGLDDEHEDLRRHVIAFERALELARDGEINIGPLFTLLLWLERERSRLRASA